MNRAAAALNLIQKRAGHSDIYLVGPPSQRFPLWKKFGVMTAMVLATLTPIVWYAYHFPYYRGVDRSDWMRIKAEQRAAEREARKRYKEIYG